jgi:hypothetical protein
VPAEVRAGGQLITLMTAYGPEADFAFPPRPANPRTPWRPEWTAKVRYKSSAMVLPGMGSMMRGGDQQKRCKPKLGHMLGGMLGGRRTEAGNDANGNDCP